MTNIDRCIQLCLLYKDKTACVTGQNQICHFQVEKNVITGFLTTGLNEQQSQNDGGERNCKYNYSTRAGKKVLIKGGIKYYSTNTYKKCPIMSVSYCGK